MDVDTPNTVARPALAAQLPAQDGLMDSATIVQYIQTTYATLELLRQQALVPLSDQDERLVPHIGGLESLLEVANDFAENVQTLIDIAAINAPPPAPVNPNNLFGVGGINSLRI